MNKSRFIINSGYTASKVQFLAGQKKQRATFDSQMAWANA
jgi:hypothetical protein